MQTLLPNKCLNAPFFSTRKGRNNCNQIARLLISQSLGYAKDYCESMNLINILISGVK